MNTCKVLLKLLKPDKRFTGEKKLSSLRTTNHYYSGHGDREILMYKCSQISPQQMFYLQTFEVRMLFESLCIELLTQGALACTFGCHVAAVAVYSQANSTVGSPCCKAN